VSYANGGDPGNTGSKVSSTPAPADANTGNGGNGITPTVTTGGINGQAGGSGIVVVRYSGAQVLSGGTVATVGSDTVHQFLTTGSSTLDLHSATIAGDIDGSGNLIWDKTGTLTLRGTDTYNGTTTINLGVLSLAGTIGSTSDLVFGTGMLDLGSTGLIRILQSNYSISDANTDIGNSLIFGDDTLLVSTFNDGFNDFTQITVIPEPRAALLGGLGLLALLRRRR
jgi:hypothetical protein